MTLDFGDTFLAAHPRVHYARLAGLWCLVSARALRRITVSAAPTWSAEGAECCAAALAERRPALSGPGGGGGGG